MASRYGYDVAFSGIGVIRGTTVDPAVGHCTQCAVFDLRNEGANGSNPNQFPSKFRASDGAISSLNNSMPPQSLKSNSKSCSKAQSLNDSSPAPALVNGSSTPSLTDWLPVASIEFPHFDSSDVGPADIVSEVQRNMGILLVDDVDVPSSPEEEVAHMAKVDAAASLHPLPPIDLAIKRFWTVHKVRQLCAGEYERLVTAISDLWSDDATAAVYDRQAQAFRVAHTWAVREVVRMRHGQSNGSYRSSTREEDSRSTTTDDREQEEDDDEGESAWGRTPDREERRSPDLRSASPPRDDVPSWISDDKVNGCRWA